MAGKRARPPPLQNGTVASSPLPRASTAPENSSKSTPSTEPSTDTGTSSSAQPIPTPRTPWTSQSGSPAQATFRTSATPASPQAGPMSSSDQSFKAAKVAIPRLKRSLEHGEGSAKSGGRHRVTHACEPCRHRKTKCSGERPACRHCQDFKIQCYYADGKRDRVKKQFGSMQDKLAEYEKVLKELSGRVGETDADIIRGVLERADQPDADEPTADNTAILGVDPDAMSELSGDEDELASGGAGSTGALDRTEEDFTREGAKATGYIGKNSDITWMQRVRQENKYGEGTSAQDANQERLHEISGPSFRSSMNHKPSNVALPEVDQGFTVQDSSYHLNDLPVIAYDAVAPYEMPTNEDARMLFDTYMTRVHPAFPIVGRMNLHNQFFKFMSKNGSQQAPRKWLAIINLIFAIAAKYSHLIQADWAGDERDHVIYFTRARMLAVTDETIFNHPDLQFIQILGLMSYYLMSIDQIHRAWCLTGMAIRASTALGLNMRNDSGELSDNLKEVRYRVWWSLYTVEHGLCGMTGRVSCIIDDHCTCPLPVPVLEEDFDTPLGRKLLSKEHQQTDRAPSSNAQTPPVPSNPSSRSGSNTKAETRSPSAAQSIQTSGDSTLEWAKDVRPNMALYFLHLVQASRLMQACFHRLYSPTSVQARWTDMQYRIKELNDQLETWYRKLPTAFDFRRNQRDKDFMEPRLSLGFLYYSIKMVIHRPCLCRLDRKLPTQSAKSQEFNHAAATTCVASAQEQLALIPDVPNVVGFLRVGPWSSVLHNLVQSVTVLMLEISFRSHHMPEQADDILDSAKKATRWLHALGDENLAAARAWQLCNSMLRDAAAKIGRSVEDISDKPPRATTHATDDISMGTGSSSTTQGPYDQHGQGYGSNFLPPTSMSMPGMSVPGIQGFLDPMATYDQFYSMGAENIDPARMQFAQAPTDAEMSFMDQFTENRPDQLGQRGNHGGRQGFT